MRLIKHVLLIGLIVASFSVPTFAEEQRDYNCSQSNPIFIHNYRLRRYVANDGKSGASWGEEYERGKYASCGFVDGHKIKLTDLNLWENREAVADKNTWVYRGIGNSCSQGHLLMFNERTLSLLIVDVGTFVSTKYMCLLTP